MPLGSVFFPLSVWPLTEQGKTGAVWRDKALLCCSNTPRKSSAGITCWTEMKEVPVLGGGDKEAISFLRHSSPWGSMLNLLFQWEKDNLEVALPRLYEWYRRELSVFPFWTFLCLYWPEYEGLESKGIISLQETVENRAILYRKAPSSLCSSFLDP